MLFLDELERVAHAEGLRTSWRGGPLTARGHSTIRLCVDHGPHKCQVCRICHISEASDLALYADRLACLALIRLGRAVAARYPAGA